MLLRSLCLLLVVVCVKPVLADETGASPPSDEAPAEEVEKDMKPPQRKAKTLGGRQFWTDVRWFHGWRIQENVLSRHFRLLDENDVRHCSGTRDECDAALNKIRNDNDLGAHSGPAVIFVHGIFRSSKSFGKLRDVLREEKYTVVEFDYASTQAEISEAALRLRELIAQLDGITEVNFVVHSMGGLVVRSMLKEAPDARLKRMVMLGVPNHGARMASLLKSNIVFRTLFGPAGQQLIDDPIGFVNDLPTPKFEFGIVAGGRGNMNGFNPLIPGDDDGTVSVASTRLPGAEDFIRLTVLHSFLTLDANVHEYCLRFLQTGRFREEGEPHPIQAVSSEDKISSPDRGD